MDWRWEELSRILRDATAHLADARGACIGNVHGDKHCPPNTEAAIRDHLHRARERIDNALQALQE